MSFTRSLIIIILLGITTLFTACCSCGKNANEENIIKGYIAVIGNEPFTKLALKTDDDKVFVLECSKEMEKELLSKQGNYFSIMYKDSRVELGLPVLVVEKAVPLNNDSK